MSASKYSIRTMSLFAVFFIVVFAKLTESERLNPESKKAIVMATINSYDIDMSFHENFFSLLYTMSPSSVRCPDKDATELSFDHLVDHFNDTFDLSEGFILKRNATLIDDSSRFLRATFSNWQSCFTKCDCTDDCKSRNNCCPLNKADEKTNIHRRSAADQHCIYPTVYSSFEPKDTEGQSFYMISDCTNRSIDAEVIRKCEYPNRLALPEMIPVYSKSINHLYRNKYCAMCNNEFVWISWRLIAAFPDIVNLGFMTRFQSSSQLTLYQLFLQVRRTIKLSVVPMYEVSDEFRCYLPEIRHEPICRTQPFLNAYQQYFLQFACSYHLAPFENRYRNVFCYLCDTLILTTQSCKTDIYRNSVQSFTGLLAVNDRGAENENAMATENNNCTCREYFDKKQDTCRSLICPLGKTYIRCTCETLLENITGLAVRIKLDIVPETPTINVVKLINETTPENIVSKAMKSINTYFKTEWGPMEIHLISMNSETLLSDSSHLKLHIIFLMRSKRVTDNMVLLKDIYDFLYSRTAKIKILKTPMILSLGTVDELENESALSNDVIFKQLYSDSSLNLGVSYLTKLLFCERITLKDEEIVLLSNTSLNMGYSENDISHIFDASERQICFDDFMDIFKKPKSVASCYSRNLEIKVYLIVLLIVVLM